MNKEDERDTTQKAGTENHEETNQGLEKETSEVDDLPLTESDPEQIKGGVKVQVPTGTVTF